MKPVSHHGHADRGRSSAAAMILEPEEPVRQHRRRHVGAGDRHPEHRREQQRHDRQPEHRRGDDAIDALIEVAARSSAGSWRRAARCARPRRRSNAPLRRGSSACSDLAQLGGAVKRDRLRRRHLLRSLQRDLLAEPFAGLLLARPPAAPAGRSSAPLRPARRRRAVGSRSSARSARPAPPVRSAAPVRRPRAGTPACPRRAAAWSRSSPDATPSTVSSSACTPSPVRATMPIAGTPRSRDRLRRSTSMPLRRASSIRFTATTTRFGDFAAPAARGSDCARCAVASTTTTVTSGRPKSRKSRATSSSLRRGQQRIRARADRRACSGPC